MSNTDLRHGRIVERQLDPTPRPPYITLAEHRPQEHEAALHFFQRALQLEPHSVEAPCNRGVTLQRMNRFDEAEHSYHEALKLEPDCAQVHVNMGVLRYERNRACPVPLPYRRGW